MNSWIKLIDAAPYSRLKESVMRMQKEITAFKSVGETPQPPPPRVPARTPKKNSTANAIPFPTTISPLPPLPPLPATPLQAVPIPLSKPVPLQAFPSRDADDPKTSFHSEIEIGSMSKFNSLDLMRSSLPEDLFKGLTPFHLFLLFA